MGKGGTVSYQYWIIRFVPNVARGEFTNIGIVCGLDGADWAVEFDLKSVRSHGRLASDLRELSRWARWFSRTVDGTLNPSREQHELSSGWLEHLRYRQANSVQFSEPSLIDVPSASEGVQLLFPHLVERLHIQRPRGLTRRKLRADVRDALSFGLNLAIGRDLFLSPKIEIGKQRGSFDFLAFDESGERVTNVWAFNIATLDVLEREIQSWNYLVDRLRKDGASLSFGSRSSSTSTVRLASDSPIDVVYDPPMSGKEAERFAVFEAALEAWGLSDVSARTLDSFLEDMAVA